MPKYVDFEVSLNTISATVGTTTWRCVAWWSCPRTSARVSLMGLVRSRLRIAAASAATARSWSCFARGRTRMEGNPMRFAIGLETGSRRDSSWKR